MVVEAGHTNGQAIGPGSRDFARPAWSCYAFIANCSRRRRRLDYE